MEMAVTEPSGIQYRKQINKLTCYVINIKSMGFYVSVAIHSDAATLVEELKYLNSSIRLLITFSNSFHHLCFDESVVHSEFRATLNRDCGGGLPLLWLGCFSWGSRWRPNES